jgi:hypothetical protein
VSHRRISVPRAQVPGPMGGMNNPYMAASDANREWERHALESRHQAFEANRQQQLQELHTAGWQPLHPQQPHPWRMPPPSAYNIPNPQTFAFNPEQQQEILRQQLHAAAHNMGGGMVAPSGPPRGPPAAAAGPPPSAPAPTPAGEMAALRAEMAGFQSQLGSFSASLAGGAARNSAEAILTTRLTTMAEYVRVAANDIQPYHLQAMQDEFRDIYTVATRAGRTTEELVLIQGFIDWVTEAQKDLGHVRQYGGQSSTRIGMAVPYVRLLLKKLDPSSAAPVNAMAEEALETYHTAQKRAKYDHVPQPSGGTGFPPTGAAGTYPGAQPFHPAMQHRSQGWQAQPDDQSTMSTGFQRLQGQQFQAPFVPFVATPPAPPLCGRCKRPGHDGLRCIAPVATNLDGSENLSWRPLLNSIMFQIDTERLFFRQPAGPPGGPPPGGPPPGGPPGGRGGRGGGRAPYGGRGRGGRY